MCLLLRPFFGGTDNGIGLMYEVGSELAMGSHHLTVRVNLLSVACRVRGDFGGFFAGEARAFEILPNPITMVRQNTKRQKVPVVLNIEHLKEPGKTAVLVDILIGLRVSELLALKWSDVDFENLELHVTRSSALQRVGPCKTEASQKPVPIAPELAEVLLM